MRRFVFLVLASLTLFGCAQAQRAERCASYGHFRGSPDFEICMRQEQAIDLYKGEQLTRALLGAAAVYSATMPVQPVYAAGPAVNCWQMGNVWHCQ